VGSEMCIRDRHITDRLTGTPRLGFDLRCGHSKHFYCAAISGIHLIIIVDLSHLTHFMTDESPIKQQ